MGTLSFPLPWGAELVQFSDPAGMAMSLGVAYQATDPSKPAVVMINLSSLSQNSLLDASQAAQRGEVLVSATAAGVTGGTGAKVALHENTQGGVLVIGLTITQRLAQCVSFLLPVGGFFGVRQTAGSNLTVASAFNQAVS